MRIRDCAGRVTAALSKKLHCPLGLLESEAMAMEDGSKIVFDALNGSSEPPVTKADVIDRICTSLRIFDIF